MLNSTSVITATVGLVLLLGAAAIFDVTWLPRCDKPEGEETQWRQREWEATLATLVLVPILFFLAVDGPHPEDWDQATPGRAVPGGHKPEVAAKHDPPRSP